MSDSIAMHPLISQSDSDDDLEPPFEIHGISNTKPPQFQEPEQRTLDTPITVQFERMEENSESDEDVPPSILFESHHEEVQSRLIPPSNTRKANRVITHRQRTRRRINNSNRIELWEDVDRYELDNFLKRIYDYYSGRGIYCILLDNLLSILSRLFDIEMFCLLCH
jgi:hypothetical protein